MAEERDGKVKVVDRRWFTADGELKEGAEATPPTPTAPPPEPPPPPAEATAAQPTPESGTGTPASAVGFLDLVDFLAQQAAALLSGQIPGRGRDPEMARFFIDLLGVVHDKSAGQLSPEEATYLEDVLYQLRSLFVAATR
ncbi:MAG TPA: DUF1844 domain-containing protein [Thermoanaerobaculaceae bacterium]|nr:DUF1844 domain-containing protein [Thermoanaerobaculaceae bacterium]